MKFLNAASVCGLRSCPVDIALALRITKRFSFRETRTVDFEFSWSSSTGGICPPSFSCQSGLFSCQFTFRADVSFEVAGHLRKWQPSKVSKPKARDASMFFKLNLEDDTRCLPSEGTTSHEMKGVALHREASGLRKKNIRDLLAFKTGRILTERTVMCGSSIWRKRTLRGSWMQFALDESLLAWQDLNSEGNDWSDA